MALLGSGTQLDPYLISTATELATEITSGTATARKYYKLVNDIDLTGATGFPISSSKSYIEIDGDGYVIRNLTLRETRYNDTAYERWGIFKTLSNTNIKNVGIEKFNLTTYAKSGAFCGQGSNLTFENCYVASSAITGYGSGADYWKYFGGFVGYGNSACTFTNCALIGVSNFETYGIIGTAVSGTSYVGGFIGYGNGHTFTNCYSALGANAYSATTEGAFFPTNTTATVNNCYVLRNATTIQTNGATLLDTNTYATYLAENPESLVGFDYDNAWGYDSSVLGGLPVPKVFIPTATIEQRDVTISVDTISMVAVIEQLPIELKVNYSISPIHVNVNRLMMDFYIETKYSVDVGVEFSIYSDGDKPKPIIIIFDNSTELLENNNNAKVIQSSIDTCVKEQSTNASIINNQNSIYHMNNRNEVRIMAFIGDTVTTRVNFKSFDGTPYEPTDVKLKIYKTTITSNVLIETISLTESDKTGIGEYTYNYVIPETLDTKETDILVYEFSGIYDGKPTLVRDKIKIRFV